MSDKLTLIEPPLQPKLITKPIEEIRCGDRVPSELPPGLFPEYEPEPDQATWRLVELEVAKKDGSEVEVKLLRPLKWLMNAGAIRTGTFPVSVEELDIEGNAAVLKVLPCPPIASGAGQVVTGTFKHRCDSLVELYLEGALRPIVCTTGHPIWSEDRNSFVTAADLNQTEQIRLVGKKISTIANIAHLKNESLVFNFEVNSNHVYHVGELGLLVHNSVEKCSVYSGTDGESADSIVNGGLDPKKAKDLGGDGSWWATTSSSDADIFASVNPADGTPARVRMEASKSLLDWLVDEGHAEKDGSVFNFFESAAEYLNDGASFYRDY